MEGSVRKRGNKWYYSFEMARVDGKRQRVERVGGRTKKEAEAALRKALTEYNNTGLRFEPTEISVSDYMDYWYKNYVEVNCKYNTQQGYMTIIEKHIKPVLGGYKLKSLTPATLQEFINQKYVHGISKNYLTSIIGVLSGSIKYAVHPCGFIKENPMQYVKYPKYDLSKSDINRKVISQSDFNRILERFPVGSTFHMLLMIGYHTGLRIGEAIALTWDDIDFDNKTVNVDKIIVYRDRKYCFGTPKTKSSIRKIKIGKTLIQSLKIHKKLQSENRLRYGQYYTQQYKVDGPITWIHSLDLTVPSGVMEPVNFVCTKENGSMVTAETFKYASKIINHMLGIDFNYHSLRHTHATVLIENGANIKDVQTRLGHSRIQTTMDTYTHVTEKMAKQSVDIFEDTLKAELPTK